MLYSSAKFLFSRARVSFSAHFVSIFSVFYSVFFVWSVPSFVRSFGVLLTFSRKRFITCWVNFPIFFFRSFVVAKSLFASDMLAWARERALVFPLHSHSHEYFSCGVCVRSPVAVVAVVAVAAAVSFRLWRASECSTEFANREQTNR